MENFDIVETSLYTKRLPSRWKLFESTQSQIFIFALFDDYYKSISSHNLDGTFRNITFIINH